jgi:hypothetical protein
MYITKGRPKFIYCSENVQQLASYDWFSMELPPPGHGRAPLSKDFNIFQAGSGFKYIFAVLQVEVEFVSFSRTCI